MPAILPEIRYCVEERLLRNLRRCRDARLRCHYLIVITLNEGLSVATVARTQKVHRDTVYRIARRFRERGELGLLDGRAGNGPGRASTGVSSTPRTGSCAAPLRTTAGVARPGRATRW